MSRARYLCLSRVAGERNNSQSVACFGLMEAPFCVSDVVGVWHAMVYHIFVFGPAFNMPHMTLTGLLWSSNASTNDLHISIAVLISCLRIWRPKEVYRRERRKVTERKRDKTKKDKRLMIKRAARSVLLSLFGISECKSENFNHQGPQHPVQECCPLNERVGEDHYGSSNNSAINAFEIFTYVECSCISNGPFLLSSLSRLSSPRLQQSCTCLVGRY